MSTLAKNSIYNGFGYISASISIFVAFVYFSRVLGPELLGVFQIEYALIMSCILFFLSFADYALAYHIGHAQNKREEQIYFSTSIALTLLISAIIALFLWVLHDILLFDLLRIDLRYAHEARLLLYYFVAYLFIQGIINNVKAVFIANNQFSKRFTLMLLHAVTTSGGSILAYISIGTLSSISLGMLVGSILPFFYVLFTIFRSHLYSLSGITRQHVVSYASYGWWTLAINASHQVHRWFDSFVLSALLGTTAVGIYAAAYNIFSELVRIPKIVGEALFPRLLKSETIDAAVSSVIQMVSILQIGIACILFLLSPFIIQILYGDDYITSSAVLMVLSISILVSPYWITNMALLALNAPRRMAFAILIATVCNIALNIPLIWKFGTVGAAIATTISYAVYYAISTQQLRIVGIHISRNSAVILLVVIATCTSVLAYVLSSIVTNNNLVSSALSVLLFTPIYGIITVLLIKRKVLQNPLSALQIQ